jgi:hypothetical protein
VMENDAMDILEKFALSIGICFHEHRTKAIVTDLFIRELFRLFDIFERYRLLN